MNRLSLTYACALLAAAVLTGCDASGNTVRTSPPRTSATQTTTTTTQPGTGKPTVTIGDDDKAYGVVTDQIKIHGVLAKAIGQ